MKDIINTIDEKNLFMNCIKRKRRLNSLLSEYKQTNKKMLDQIHLSQLMSDDEDFMTYFRFMVIWELRFYNRLLKLKSK